MNFSMELVINEQKRKEFALEIAELFDKDKTEPTPQQDDWHSDKMLRELESEMVQKRSLCKEFANICLEARNIAANASIQTLLLLGQINGLRRLSEKERPDDKLRSLIKEAQENIKHLKKSSRKTRLLSLWCYHGGIYARVVGDYKLAAASQKRSASLGKTAGDQKTYVISHYCAQVERVNDALVHKPGSVRVILNEMNKAGKQLKIVLENMTDDSTAVRWLYFNYPFHQLVSHFWAKKKYDGTDDIRLLRELNRVDPELSTSLLSTVMVALAIDLWSLGNLGSASILANGIVLGIYGAPPAPEYIATTHLIRARVSYELSRKSDSEQCREHAEQAKKSFRLAAAVKGSAHQVRAIAKRELKTLGKT